MANSRKQNTTGTGARKRLTLGPVELLARDAATIWNATDRIDGSNTATHAAPHLHDREDAISTLASLQSPRTADGAAFLAMIAASDADVLASSTLPPHVREAHELRLSRCLHSVVTFLCHQGATVAPIVRDALAGDHANPQRAERGRA